MKYTREETQFVFDTIKENPAGFLYLVDKYCPKERFDEVKQGMTAIGIPAAEVNYSRYDASSYPSNWTPWRR